MRLICPKCDAQYNVADDAIPKGGRDVQCSTCGHTWFQTEMSRVLTRPVSRVLSRPIPNAVRSETREPEKATASSRDVGAYDVPHQHKEKSQTHQPKHRPVDANIANILREEAAREYKVPAADQGNKNAQQKSERKPADPADIEATRQRIAKMTGDSGGMRTAQQQTTGGGAAVAANPRAIPGISEINAVLRARDENNSNAEITESERVEAIRRKGFRRGFFLVLGLFAIIIAPYVLAEQIIENIPQSRETMTQYVAIIDQLRLAMNTTISGILESVNALIDQF